GRPDMSALIFTKAIMEGRPFDVFNEGKMQRDFTYIDDIVTGIVGTLDQVAVPNDQFDPAAPDPATSYAPYRIFNIGNHEPIELTDFIASLERAIGKKAVFNMLPMQAGEVAATYGDTE